MARPTRPAFGRAIKLAFQLAQSGFQERLAARVASAAGPRQDAARRWGQRQWGTNDDTRRGQGRRALSARPRRAERRIRGHARHVATNGSAPASGIERRHFAAEGQTTSDLATRAARAALADAGLDGRRPRRDHRRHLDARPHLPLGRDDGAGRARDDRGFAFDVQAVCAGFVYALANANALIVSGQARRVLVIGAETFSRIMDWTDRATCVLFGDGAGALVLEAAEGAGTAADRGILSADLHSDGALPRHALCRWRRLDHRHRRPSADAGQRALPPGGREAGRDRRRGAGQGRPRPRRRRLDRAAPGQHPHHRRRPPRRWACRWIGWS